MVAKSLYIAKRADNPSLLKVGITTDVRLRMKSLSVAYKTKVELVHSDDPQHDAHYLERAMHFLLRERHVDGEWFSLTLTEALEALEEARSYASYSALRTLRLSRAKVSIATFVQKAARDQVVAAAAADGVPVTIWLERVVLEKLGLPYEPRSKWAKQLKF